MSRPEETEEIKWLRRAAEWCQYKGAHGLDHAHKLWILAARLEANPDPLAELTTEDCDQIAIILRLAAGPENYRGPLEIGCLEKSEVFLLAAAQRAQEELK